MDSLGQAMNELNPQKVDSNTIVKINKLAYYYTFRDTAKAHGFINKGITWAKKINDPKGLAESYRIMGILQRDLTNYQSSLLYYDKALKILKSINYNPGLGKVYLDIGVLYRSLGNQKDALKNELKSIDYFKLSNDSLHIYEAYTNIGTLYNIESKNKKAIHYFTKAANFFKSHQKMNVLSIVYENLGVSYEDLKNYPKALNYYRKSINIERKLGNKHITAYNYQNIGEIYDYKKQYKKALNYYFKAQKINKQLGEKGVISNTYSSIGNVYLEENKLNLALKYANISLKYARESNTLEYLEYAEELKSQVYSALHEYKKAYQYQGKYYTYKDSLEKKKEFKKFTDLATQYETKQKEEEISLLQKKDALQKARLKKEALFQKSLIIVAILFLIIILLLLYEYRLKKKSESVLRKKNKELKEANARILQNERIVEKQADELQAKNKELTNINERLKELDESKNDFFRIAAHDMKNPLIGISSLTEIMMSADYESVDDLDQLKEQLKLIHKSSVDMIALISRLLTVNQIDTDSFVVTVSQYSLNDIIEDVIHDQSTAANQKGITLDYPNDQRDIKANIDKEAFRQVMENLVSNAIKYSYKDSVVKIEEEKTVDFVTVKVIDEGQGLSKEDQDKLFQKFTRLTPRPTNGESSNGLGLYIVKKYVDAMNGEITCESKPGKGTTFSVKLPLTDDKDPSE